MSEQTSSAGEKPLSLDTVGARGNTRPKSPCPGCGSRLWTKGRACCGLDLFAHWTCHPDEAANFGYADAVQGRPSCIKGEPDGAHERAYQTAYDQYADRRAQ